MERSELSYGLKECVNQLLVTLISTKLRYCTRWVGPCSGHSSTKRVGNVDIFGAKELILKIVFLKIISVY
jgi:hypothetical protein